MKEKKESDSFFKELGCFMKPYKANYIWSVALSVISVAASIAAYGFMGLIVSMFFTAQASWNRALLFCAAAIACKLLYAVLLNVSTWISHHGAYNTLRDIRLALSDKMVALPLGYFEERGSGRLKTLLVDHVESMEKTLAHMLPELTANLLAPLCCVVWMFFIDWRLALISLAWILLGMSVTAGMMKNYESKYSGQIQALKAMNQSAVEYVRGIEVIKNFGREEECYQKYSDAVYGHASYNVNWQKETQKYSSLGMAIAPFSLFPVIIFGLLFYNGGTIAASSVFMMMILTLGIFVPLMNASGYFDQLAAMGTNAREINSVLQYPSLKRGTLCENRDGSIEFRNVSFAYTNGKGNALDNVSFAIPQGHMFALVGPSGSGKSTIAKLIAGYWDADSGEIQIGGHPIQEYTQQALNQMIAYVDQETFLFDTSILENIRVGRPSATDEEVIAAAVRAGCHDFIMRLPSGYATQSGECGNLLSGGERQRIAIARAIIKDSPIIILDEATASADPENEALIQRALSSAVAGKTLVVVAHRLSTIVGADAILFVENGKAVQQGTHEQLLNTCSGYREFYRISEEGGYDCYDETHLADVPKSP